MSDLYVNPLSGDLDLTGSRLYVTKQIEQLARQKLEITLKTFRGEWFANRLFGIPYLANDHNNIQLLEKNTKDLLDLEIRSVILGIESITEITSYTSILSADRNLTISFTAVTESGEEVEITDLIIL